MARFDFPKSARILKTAEFDRVFSCRCSCADGLMVAYVAQGDSRRPRLGLVVSRKVGNAVVRNRWKRALRTAFRLVQHELPEHLDLVVLPRPAARPDVACLQDSFRQLAARGVAKLAAKGRQEQPL